MGLPVLKACLELTLSAPLILVREPHNPADANAILLLNITGSPVGYVQREVAARVRGWFDEGLEVHGKVIRAPNLRNGRMKMRLRYPRALLWADYPPPEVGSFESEDAVEKEKERILEKVR